MSRQEKLDLLHRVEQTRVEMDLAKAKHYETLREAHKAGISYVGIAMSCGVSETAIRNLFKRNGW